MLIYFVLIATYTEISFPALQYDFDPELTELCSDILSNSIETRLSVKDRMLGSRKNSKKVCDKMIEIIGSDKTFEEYGTPKQIALLVMAHHVDYRSDPKVIIAFIDNLNVRFPEQLTNREILAPDQVFPSLRGLLLIGEKATQPILEKIKNTDDRTLHNNFAFWFSKYYGQRVALHYLGNIIEENPNMVPEHRQRIVYVLGQISKFK